MSPFRTTQLSTAVVHAGLLALLPLFWLGCDEAPEPQATATPSQQTAEHPAIPQIKWLDANKGITPERWLASRAAHADLTESDPKVEAMRAELNEAAERFRDPPRMIANRAVQLQGMLAAQGIDERAPELIKLLSSAALIGGPKEGFGSVCQHYFNLRQQGVGRDAALEQLKETSLLGEDNGVHRA